MLWTHSLMGTAGAPKHTRLPRRSLRRSRKRKDCTELHVGLRCAALWSCCCVQPTHTDVGQSGLSRCVRSSCGSDRKPRGACRMLYIACFQTAQVPRRCPFAHMRSQRCVCSALLSLCGTALRSYLLRLVTKLPSARTKLEVRRESLATTAESHCGLHETATGNMQRATCAH